MRLSSKNPASYALLLAVGLALFLIAVGFRVDTLPFQPNQPYSDAAISHWPAALFLQRSVRAGYFPLWRNLLMGGQPFAANPLNKVWYPPQWLVILLPPALHLNLLAWGHLLLAGLGLRAFGRQLGLTAATASVIGIAYAFTPRLIGALGAGHLDILYAMGWFPWMLWGTHQFLFESGNRYWQAAMLASSAALCFLADIRLSVFIFATCAAYTVWRWRELFSPPPNPDSSPLTPTLPPVKKGREVWGATTMRKISPFLPIVFSGILFLGLTTVQWLPLATLAPYLSRGDLTPADAAVFSLQPLDLLGLVIPRFPTSHETLVYPGLLVLILAIMGVIYATRYRRGLLFWLIIAVIALLYALGDNFPLWSVLVKLIPGLLWLRVPARAWIVASLALLILAGFGLDRLATLFRNRGATVIAVCGLIIVLDLLWTDVTLVEGRPQSQWLDPYAPIAQALLDDHVTRFYSPSYSFPQQAAAYWNIQSFGGIDPFQIKSFIPAFEQATGVHASSYSVTLPAFEGDFATVNKSAVINANYLGEWGVSDVVSAFPIDDPQQHLQEIALVNGIYIYKNASVRNLNLTWNGPNCYVTSKPTSFSSFVTHSRLPGWSDWKSHSQPVIGFEPEPIGSDCYRPPDFVPSLAISGMALITVIVVFRVSRRR